MAEKTMFLLGATGFVGSNLACRLLEHGHRLLCLTRATRYSSGRERLRGILSQFFADGRLEHLEKTRLKIFEGDITKPKFGLQDRDYEQLRREPEEIWHCAALLSFEERQRKEAEKCNVAGTQGVLELARTGRGKRVHYLSTAYVAGRRQGLIMEQDLSEGFGFKNPYEWTKSQAETLIREYCRTDQIQTTIYRPSVIIGDTKPGTVCSSGIYRVTHIIAAIADKYGMQRSNGKTKARIRIHGSRDCGLNLVPIDFVVKALTTIAEREEASGKVFHIVNARPTPNETVVGSVGDALGLKLELADKHDFSSEPMTVPEQVLKNTIKMYLPYLQDRLIFDDSNTRRALGDMNIACPLITRTWLASLLGYSQNAARMSNSETEATARPCLEERRGRQSVPQSAIF